MQNLKDIVIIYHDQCQDGFGAAYAAWKKFGDTASYVPRKTQEPVPEGLVDKELYIVDYSYKKDELEMLRANNHSVVVIDHHKSAEEAVTAFPENIFDLNHSGATLTWRYFHPDIPVPQLLLYVEDHDLWNFKLEHHREVNAALKQYNQDFETWDQLVKNLEDRDHFSKLVSMGGVISDFEDDLVQNILRFKEKVEFEGHTAYAVNAERIYRSIIGHELAKLSEAEGGAPLGIVYYRYDGMVHCSLRSNGDFSVHTLAEKYGGGGHPNAASIRVDNFSDLPFSFKS